MKGILVVLGCGFGYVISRFIPDGPLSIYLPLLVSYHLLLGVLVVTAMQDHGHKLNPIPAVATHTGFFVALIVIATVGSAVPYFEYSRFALPAIALVELMVLFRGNKKGQSSDRTDAASNSSAEDYEEFILYMRGNDRPFSKAGHTIRDEYNSWLAHRAKRPAVATMDAPSFMDAGQRPAA